MWFTGILNKVFGRSKKDVTEAKIEYGYCPCCGYATLDPAQRFEMPECPVCGWIDDRSQLCYEYSDSGANDITLLEAQENYREFGACHPEKINAVRKPNEDEDRNPDWKINNNISFSFRQELLKYALGANTAKDLPGLAVMAILEGARGQAIETLSDMPDDCNPGEIEHNFKKAVKEQGLSLPGPEQAAIELAQHYADLVIEGKLDPVIGVREMLFKSFGYCYFEMYDLAAPMDCILFDKVNALYNAFYELNTAEASDENKSNSQLMLETKPLILAELIEWRKQDPVAHFTRLQSTPPAS